MQFPISYFESNLIITDEKDCWAGYEVVGFQYDHKSKSKKTDDFRRLTNFFTSLKTDVRLLLLPRVYSFQEHFESLKDQATGPFKEFAKMHANDTRDYLTDLIGKNGSNYVLYVFFKLDVKKPWVDIFADFKTFVSSMFKGPKRELEELAGLSGIEIFEKEFETLKGMERQTYSFYASNSFSPGLSLKSLYEQEIEWMVRRNFWKGIGTPPQSYLFQKKSKLFHEPKRDAIKIPTKRKTADRIVKGDQKVIRPRSAEFLNLTEGLIELTDRREIKLTQQVNGEDVSSYCSYLTISDVPDGYWIPGNEWLYTVQDFPFPVAVSVYISPVDNEKSKSKVINKRLEIKDQGAHSAEANEFPLDVMEAAQDAAELEKVLKDYNFPLLDVSVTFELFASNEEELRNNRQYLIGNYKNMDFEIVCPSGSQWQLFNEFIPGSKRNAENDYVQRITPPEMAASMLGATKQLGDNEGFFIGFTGALNKPVFYNPGAAPLRDKSASGSFTGTLGGGKSYASNYIAAYLSSLYGGKCLIIDPKGDRGHWKDHLHEFDGELDFVTLDDREEDFGKLDPYGFLDPNEAGRVATNIITFLAEIKTSDERFFLLSDAINMVKDQPNPSMNKIITTLEKMPEEPARKLARQLEAFKRAPYGKLLFHEGKLNSIKLDKRITILQVNNLQLPNSNTARSDYDVSEMLSVAIMYPITRFAIKFSENKEEFTVVTLDEAWALMGTKEGKDLVDRLIRTGRSNNAAIYIISQNVKDLMESKKNLGVKFVFVAQDQEEIGDILEFLNLEKTSENYDLIRSIEKGVPLMQDLDGRIGKVAIDTVFEHVHLAFSTTPKKKEEKVG